ncbi:MAG: peptidylprolyl isomerase [Bacteroidales bacterium]
MTQIKKDDTVKVHYTGKFQNGDVFDTSKEREPLEFKVGEGKLIPGFEKAVVGMNEKEKKVIEISSEDAYGPRHEELVQKVNKSNLPEDIEPELGMELVSKHPDGQQMVVRVVEVADDSIMIDANHPLAGEDLTFEIEVVEVNA